MKVGELVIDWYYPGFGLIIDIIDDSKSVGRLVKVYFPEVGATEWRYEHEVVTIKERNST